MSEILLLGSHRFRSEPYVKWSMDAGSLLTRVNESKGREEPWDGRNETTDQTSAAKFIETVYAVQLEHCRSMINASGCADRFAAKLTEYSEHIIGQAGSPDLTRWEPCVKLLKAAFLSELEDLNFEFCAHHEKIAAAKEAQATAVATARTVAATKDVTKPMSDLISVEVKRQLAEKAIAQNEKKKNAKPARPNAAASTSTTSSTKPKPSSSSSTKHAAGHRAKEDWRQKTTAKQPKGKRPGENGGDGTVANRKGANEKGKKKSKAKAEPQDSSSD
ncbi:hypothetical protein C8R44DRAFT_753502 [Mycena epipterygia]|nr:hypothetical protein C8R44DRAFT_753502 [Mycena epipterygia]